MKRYALEIYLPDNPGLDVACYIESDEPFLPIQKGDLINPRTWTQHYSQNLAAYGRDQSAVVLKVTGVEHFIIQSERGFTMHKLGVFSIAVPDTPVARERP